MRTMRSLARIPARSAGPPATVFTTMIVSRSTLNSTPIPLNSPSMLSRTLRISSAVR